MITIAHVLELVGAVSVVCSALSHVIPGKVGAVLGEIGVDIAGFLKELRK